MVLILIVNLFLPKPVALQLYSRLLYCQIMKMNMIVILLSYYLNPLHYARVHHLQIYHLYLILLTLAILLVNHAIK